MHALTGKDILVENKLFATLGTAVGEMKMPKIAATDDEEINNNYQGYGKILVNDTV
jgi:50S ribosomal subunit-associated GTPase HflX